MSAFAAFQKTKPPQHNTADVCETAPTVKLLSRPIESSNWSCEASNTIPVSDGLIIGLRPSEYVLVEGSYVLEVLRGTCLVNNVHSLNSGSIHRVITSSAESLPILACADSPDTDTSVKEGPLPAYELVLKLANYHTGLEDLGAYCPLLKGLYPDVHGELSFHIATKAVGVYFDGPAINALREPFATAAVFGVPAGGKRSFAQALINAEVLRSGTVAYMDLDPASTMGPVPYCMSLKIHTALSLGDMASGFCDGNVLDMHCYYGFRLWKELPDFWLQQALKLVAHYRSLIAPVPLVVRYPAWNRGYGKDLLIKVHEVLLPKLYYMSQNNASQLDGFVAPEYDADNSDADALAGLGPAAVLQSVRRDTLPKQDCLVRNKLLYFHQGSNAEAEEMQQGQATWDFTRHILTMAPLKLRGFAVCVLGLEPAPISEFPGLIEATVTGIFVGTLEKLNKASTISTELFCQLDARFVGQAMVHSASRDAHDNTANVYLAQPEVVAKAIAAAREKGQTVILARGEGLLPSCELGPPQVSWPYVDRHVRPRVGGVWRVRKNIARKR